MRLQKELRSVQGIGAVIQGTLTPNVNRSTSAPAAVLVWVADRNNNHLIEYSELELIEYEPSKGANGHTIYTYTATVLLDPQFSKTLFNDPAAIPQFKAVATPKKMATHVDAAKFYVLNGASTVQRPVFEFALAFVRDDGTTTQYGAVSLRAPGAPPTN